MEVVILIVLSCFCASGISRQLQHHSSLIINRSRESENQRLKKSL